MVVPRLWLLWVPVLAMASAVALPRAARADSTTGGAVASMAPADAAAATDRARTAVAAAQQAADRAGGQRSALAKRYQDQLAAVDSLKHEHASWRRDRDLRAALADSADTANQLARLDQTTAGATAALADARRAFAKAIDAELAAGATGPRAVALGRERAALQLEKPAKKIVLPDTTIDQLADPEELEQQAQVITDTEKQLANQMAALDTQAGELARVAELRKSADRAKDMMIRDDDQPHRDMAHSGTSLANTNVPGGAAAPSTGGPGATVGNGTGGTDSFDGGHTSFEVEASFVLGEVIDPSTLDTLARASRSGDPARRAAAARAARDAVAARIEQLKKQRAKIEQREQQLRGK